MTALTPLQIAALGVFSERAMHPYEAFTLLSERHTDFVVKLKASTLYHAISRLAEQDMLQVVGTERAGNRPERTTYTITETGRAAFLASVEALVATPQREYPSLLLGLSEVHNVPAKRAVKLIRQRCEILTRQHQALLSALQSCDDAAVPRVYVLEVELAAHQCAAEIEWLTRLIERIEAGALPWHHQRTQAFLPTDPTDPAGIS